MSKSKIQSYSAPVAIRMMERFLTIGCQYYCLHNKSNMGQCSGEDLIADLVVCCTNLSFSCEIGLKLIIYAETHNPNSDGHYLNDLFGKLSPTSQTIIRSFTLAHYNSAILNQSQMTEESFNQELNMIKDSFVKTRYWFEEKHGEDKSMRILFYSLLQDLSNNILTCFHSMRKIFG